ncbi:MAG TPA: hypothetical protein VG052_00235 [Puia sp.]|jgi:hypothetical protein|nr:hypothetical protein [Puia sp.]
MGISKQNNHSAKKPLTIGSKKKAVINPNMVDLSNDPYFVSKAESAKRLLSKYGTPKSAK